MSEEQYGKGYLDLKGDLADLRECASDLIYKLKRVKKGENLTKYSYNHYDVCYDYYCSGCGKHMGEAPAVYKVPLEANCKCHQCKKSPEQIQAEKEHAQLRKHQHDMVEFQRILKENPGLLEGLVS